jgi:DNA-directed RNA polymerase subunit F
LPKSTLIASILDFEAANCDALMISEVYLLLEHRREQNEQKDDIDEMSENFSLTLNYAQHFARFKKRELIRAVRG